MLIKCFLNDYNYFFEGVTMDMPCIRDNDNQMYIRQWSGGILFGCFELDGKPCFEDGVPNSFEFQLLPEDWDHCRMCNLYIISKF